MYNPILLILLSWYLIMMIWVIDPMFNLIYSLYSSNDTWWWYEFKDPMYNPIYSLFSSSNWPSALGILQTREYISNNNIVCLNFLQDLKRERLIALDVIDIKSTKTAFKYCYDKQKTSVVKYVIYLLWTKVHIY